MTRLKKALPDLDDGSVIRFDLEETPVEAVIEEADTLPFLARTETDYCWKCNFLKAQDKNREKVTHNLTQLESMACKSVSNCYGCIYCTIRKIGCKEADYENNERAGNRH